MWTFPLIGSPMRVADLVRLPTDLACSQMLQQARLHRRWLDVLQQPGIRAMDQWLLLLRDGLASVLGWPFDLARTQHAAGVLAGGLPHSLLESTQFEQKLGAVERLTLGPLARSV